MPDEGPVRVLSRDEVKARLGHLKGCLQRLPDHLPDDTYNFRGFSISAEESEDRGRNGALNHILECSFCPQGRVAGPFLIKGRGPGLDAIVDVLAAFILEEFPEDVVLQKWIDDLISAAEHTCGSIRQLVPEETGSGDVHGVKRVRLHVGPDPEETATLAPVPKKKKSNPDPGTAQGTIKISSIMDRYEDIPEPPPKGKGGRPRSAIVDELIVFTRLRQENKIIYRCVGAPSGCDKSFSSRDRGRILKHAAACQYLPAALRQRVSEEQAGLSPSARLAAQLAGKASTSSAPIRNNPSVEIITSMPVQDGSSSTTTPSNRTTPHISPDPSSRAASSDTSALPAPSNGPTPSATPETSSAAEPKHSTSHAFFENAKKEGRRLLAARLDVAIVNLICVGGLPPRVADLPEWKAAWNIANRAYDPASRTTIEDIQIPQEAAFVREKQIELLKKEENLTITFDGGSLNSTQSNTTIHVISEDRRVFFFDGIDSTGFSHTGVYYFESLATVMESIGPRQFRGICSDNTGNTSKARDLIVKKYPWMIILPDACHRLSRLCGDICKMPHFKEPIAGLRRTLKFMKKSGEAREHLRRKREEMSITRGLVTIGKTRFASIYHSAASLLRCMPALRDLCTSKTITIKDVNDKFLNGAKAWAFNASLESLVKVLEPMGKAITCLESTHATASDVYIFWLACMAGIHDIITADDLGDMDNSVKEKIREAMNKRWMQMVENPPHDIFFPAFVLDPRFRGHDLLNDLNPLAVKSIKIGGTAPGEKPKYPKSINRTGNFLLKLLRIEYEQRGTPIAGLSKTEALDTLKTQVAMFVVGSWPFDRPLPSSGDPFEWWKRLDEDLPQAQPLAHLGRILFALTPNSMADERTQSSYTWLNSYLRNRQQVATVTRMIQIRNWVKSNRGYSRPVRRPTVKFRDINHTIYGAKTSGSKSKAAAGATGESIIEDDDLGSSSEEDSGTEESESESEDGDTITSWDDIDKLLRVPRELDDSREQVNLESPALRDYLSDEPVVLESTKKGKGKGKGKAVVVDAAQERVLIDADWQMD